MSRSKQTSPLATDLPIVKVDFNPAAIEPLRARALAELESVQGIEVPDEDTAKLAAEVLVSIAAVRKDAVAQSKAWLEPLKSEVERIRAPFKAIEDTCDAARGIVDKALGAFALARAEAERLALAAATKAIAEDRPAAELTTALQARDAAAPVAMKGVTFKAFWTAEVINPGMVPHEFLAPDLKKIAAHAGATSPDAEPTPIPGVRFKLETSSTVRTKGLA